VLDSIFRPPELSTGQYILGRLIDFGGVDRVVGGVSMRRSPTGRGAVRGRGAVAGVAQDKLGKTYKLGGGKSVGEARRDESCGTCGGEVGGADDGLCCEECQKWFHCGCLGMNQVEYKMWSGSDHPWFCITCREVIKQKTRKVDKMEEILGAILEKVTKLEERAESEEQRINEKVVQVCNEIIEKTCNEKIEEKFEQEKRRKNLIIFNVKEQDQELSPKDKEIKDMEFCEKLFGEEDKLNVEGIGIRKVIRIGKRNTENNRPRPIIVKLEEDHQPWIILKNSRNLRAHRDENVRSIRIAKDLTMMQREEEKKLYEELKERRERGEEGWYIKSGKLVRGARRQEDVFGGASRLDRSRH
jgi:hypothetical protein